MTNTSQLRTFVAVLDAGSIVSAAQELQLSPSAVSQQLAALEKELKAVLFIRHARKIEPTPLALRLRTQAVRILQGVNALKIQAHHESGHRSLAIGLYASLSARIAGPVKEAFDELGINVTFFIADPPAVAHFVRTHQESDNDALPEGVGLDLGLVFHVGQGSPRLTPDLEQQWLETEPFDVVFPASWNVGESLSPHELAQLPWIVHQPGSGDALIMERTLTFDGYAPRIAARSDDFQASLDLVRAGVGAALIPHEVLRTSRLAGVVVRAEPSIQLSRGSFVLHAKNHPDPDLLQTAISVIRKTLELDASAQKNAPGAAGRR